MTEAIKTFFLETVGPDLCVFFCAMLPVIELRGAIPLGAGLGLPWLRCFLLALGGNLLPVPLILFLMKGILKRMKGTRLFGRFAGWLEAKAEKNRGKVEKYAFWGLALFVAIPAPGTGAWTGSLVASLTGIRFRRAFLSVVIGVVAAGVLVTALSYGVVAAIAALF